MSTGVYNVGEKVLCYHGPLIYEAKIIKYEHWDETTTKLGSVGPHFFVHYKGWKQTYVSQPLSETRSTDPCVQWHWADCTDGTSGCNLAVS